MCDSCKSNKMYTREWNQKCDSVILQLTTYTTAVSWRFPLVMREDKT